MPEAAQFAEKVAPGAHGNDPAHHFVEVEDGTLVRFLCTAPSSAPCRNYPACECESWDRVMHGHDGTLAVPGHEDVPHDECWMKPHVEASDLPDDAPGDLTGTFPISAWWEYDCLPWEFAELHTPPGERT